MRNERQRNIHDVSEKDMVTGFTFKGLFLLVILLIVGSLLKDLFF